MPRRLPFAYGRLEHGETRAVVLAYRFQQARDPVAFLERRAGSWSLGSAATPFLLHSYRRNK